jgi:RNA polymerase sigma factor for flagellar operon FliA
MGKKTSPSQDATPAHDDGYSGMSRNQLVERYVQLVKIVASKIASRLPKSVELDDLISAGVMGLIDAIDKYDASKSQNFKKYAEIRIRGAILDELRAMDWVSRSVRRQSAQLTGMQQQLRRQFGREATPDEVAKEMGLDLDQYFKLLDKLKPVLLLSYENQGPSTDGESRSFDTIIRDTTASDPSKLLHDQNIRTLIKELNDTLPEKQRLVVKMYYFEGMNLKEIGSVLNVTESRVSQLNSQAIRSLKTKVKRRLGGDA